MLTSLHIKNYALIDELNVQFTKGLTIITGETGAGKSILLGGLALVLGKRADLSQVKNTEKKCIIEAEFNVADYKLQTLFKTLDLDYDANTIIRREILPSGKSRAFINDSPITLDHLTTLSSYLIDIHSQHQTQQLTDDNYQFKVIDALAKNYENLDNYKLQLKAYKTLQKEIEQLKANKAEATKAYDYNLFLYNELEDAKLEGVDLEDLESQYEALSNVELIEEKLSLTKSVLNEEELGIVDKLRFLKQELIKIASFGSSYEELSNRMHSVSIELDDILVEIDQLENQLITDPQALNTINSALAVINNLFQKHNVDTIAQLIKIKNELKATVDQSNGLDEQIQNKTNHLQKLKNSINSLAATIHSQREKVIPILIKKLEVILSDLGIPNARFKIELQQTEHFLANGKDTLNFLFTANKGSAYTELKKSASGGELSRIMLAVKSILADYIQLPSIMFDEIDTGVSGEIAHKMGEVMKQMSSNMQVFAITHLPQIAAKGHTHFKVFKDNTKAITVTQLKQLNTEERIVEIAQMLGGADLTESAISHAKQLLN